MQPENWFLKSNIFALNDDSDLLFVDRLKLCNFVSES